jgi:hypothetical protein
MHIKFDIYVFIVFITSIFYAWLFCVQQKLSWENALIKNHPLLGDHLALGPSVLRDLSNERPSSFRRPPVLGPRQLVS